MTAPDMLHIILLAVGVVLVVTGIAIDGEFLPGLLIVAGIAFLVYGIGGSINWGFQTFTTG